MRVPKRIAKAVPPAAIRGVRDAIEYADASAPAALQRLAGLPRAVWELPIDWQRYARALDHALNVATPLRTASEERKLHATIERRLRQAAAAVHRLGKMDPYIDVLLSLGTSYGAPRMTTWKRLPIDFSVTQRGPTLSQFLLAMAKMYAGDGGVVVPGLSESAHRPDTSPWMVTKQHGAHAAAAEAFERVRTLLRELTGAPHDDLCADLVRAYHPDVTDDALESFARAARQRRKVANGKAHRK